MKAITRTLIADVTLSTWTEVDVTSLVGGDAGDVAGVMLEIVNTENQEHEWGVRKNGSDDTLTGVIEDLSHTFVAIGVDGDDIFELWMDDTGIDIFMVGYFINAEAVFSTNASDVSLGTITIWTDITVHADAKAGFFLVFANGAQAAFGFRENGSTDNRATAIFNGDLRGAMMGCDVDGKVEGRIGNTAIDFYQVGYLTDNVTTFANAKDYSDESAVGSYVDADLSSDIPAGNTGAFFQGFATSEYAYGIRKNGTTPTDNYYDFSYHQFGWVEIDTNRVIEQKIENVACGLFIWGYTNEPAAAANITLSTASLSASGQSTTITPGAVSKALDTALLTAGGQVLTIVPGTATIALATALANANGQAVTITPGAVSTLLATAIATATGQVVTIDPGGIAPTEIVLSTADVTASGQLITIVPGAVSKGLNTALLTANGQALSVVPGAVSKGLNTASLVAGGQILGIVPGAVDIALTTALATANGQAVTIIPGVVSTALASATLNAIGQTLTIVPGAANITLTTAVITVNGQQVVITIGYNIVLNTATVSANGQVIAIVPGAVSTALQTASITANDIPITILPGGVSIGLDTAALSASGQALQVLPGVYVVSLATASVQADGQQIGIVPGAISILIDTAALIASGQGISISDIAAITAIVKEWTLRIRSTDFNLLDRTTGMTLKERLIDWSLKDDDR